MPHPTDDAGLPTIALPMALLSDGTVRLQQTASGEDEALRGVARVLSGELPEWGVFVERERLAGRAAYFSIFEHLSDRLVGAIDLVRTPCQSNAFEIGFMISPTFRRQGCATRAVVLARDWTLHSAGGHQVVAIVARSNVGSQSVLTRARFRLDRSDADDSLVFVYP